MTNGEPIVIAGANLAGGSAADALRRGGYKGRLVLVGAEPHRPYRRPPLSKEFMAADYQTDKVFFRPQDYYQRQGIELRLGVRATGLDTGARTVALSTGDQLGFDKLLIATGVRLRRLSVPGADLPGIHYLRTLPEAEAIKQELVAGRRVVIVGAGFIGAEIAATCRARGLDVTVVEVLPAPMQRVLGTEVGEIMAGYHRAEGVELLVDDGVQAFRGDGGVREVLTASGRVLPCDFVVAGIGVEPEVDWLAGSGVELGDGVVVDEYCETNVPGIYAAGDVASWWHPTLNTRLRVEHETNAQNQALHAARNMLGRQTVYEPVPFVWSDQYDLQIRYAGHATAWDQLALRGNPERRSFCAFYLESGRIRAALGVNRAEEIMHAQHLIQAGTHVAPEMLADEGVDLSEVSA